MALYDTLSKALDQKDAGMYTDLFHENYEFVRHQTGTSMHSCLLYTSDAADDC